MTECIKIMLMERPAAKRVAWNSEYNSNLEILGF